MSQEINSLGLGPGAASFIATTLFILYSHPFYIYILLQQVLFHSSMLYG